MRVLWLSASIFNDKKGNKSGVWQQALAERLSSCGNIELGNVAVLPKISHIEKNTFLNIKQWGIPPIKEKNNMPSKSACDNFKTILDSFNPELIMIWGTENQCHLLPYVVAKNIPIVLCMQGVLGSIGDCMLNGFTIHELFKTIGIRELVYHSSIFSEQRSFWKCEIIEKKMIQKSDYIITQSDWTTSQIKHINPNALILRTHRSLRSEFLKSKNWQKFNHPNKIIYTASFGYPIKGLFVLLKALVIIKEQYPSVELRIAGGIGRTDYLGVGYLRFLRKFISKQGLENNVTWLEAINADEIISQLQQSNVFVNPSYIESYSQVVAEAMSIGTPSVISYAGAMPELASSDEALFFTPGDYKRCAYHICRLFSDELFSNQISEKSHNRSVIREQNFDIVEEQLNIYSHIINDYVQKSTKCS